MDDPLPNTEFELFTFECITLEILLPPIINVINQRGSKLRSGVFQSPKQKVANQQNHGSNLF